MSPARKTANPPQTDDQRRAALLSKRRIRPDHLEAVAAGVNVQRAWDANPRSECTRGHALTAENSYIRPKSGRPSCRTCLYARKRAYEARKRATA